MKKAIIILTVLIVSFFCLELIFRTVIPASAEPFFNLYKYDNFTIGKYSDQNGSEGIKTYGVLAKAKSKWHINNHGWNSNIDYSFENNDTNKLRIALIGDGYVEALNIDTKKNIGSLLNQELPKDFETYTFGMSDASFSQYMNLGRYVKKYYTPDIIIFFVNENDFYQSFVNNGKSKNLSLAVDVHGKIIEYQPKYSEIENKYKLVKKSALGRYLYYNLNITSIFSADKIITDDNISREQKQFSINPAMSYSERSITLYSNYILKEIKESFPNEKAIIVYTGDLKSISNDLEAGSRSVLIDNILKLNTTELDIDYINAANVFIEKYNKNGIELKSNYNYYWNSYAHEILLDTLNGFILNNR